jgi:PAS domain S-box-containing protein
LSKPRLNLSLYQKAMVLIAVPLAFELCLLGALAWLLNESEREARIADHARTVITQTTSTIQLFFDASFALVVLDAYTQPYFQQHLDKLVARIPGSLERLKNQVKDKPRHVAIVDRVAREAKDAVRWVNQASEASVMGQRLNVVEALQMRQNLGRMIDELDQIIKDEEQQQRKKPLDSEKLKQLVKTLLVFGIAMSIVIALLLVVVFQQGTTRRLKTLIDNSIRLGRGQELSPLLAGNDEIAFIDRTFHEAAAALKESARRESAVVDYAVDVICSFNASGEFTRLNPAAEKLWGYEASRLSGKSFSEVICKDDQERWLTWSEAMKTTEKSGEIENRIVRADGTLVDMLWSCHWSALENSLFCVAHDITYRNELERLKQQFVSMISHDLRTPLNAVKSTLTLLGANAWGKLTEQGLAKVAMAETSLRHSIDLINNLLDLDKMESGTVSLAPENLPLRPLLQRCRDAVSALAEQRAVEIEIPGLEVEVRADERRLSQVIINLLGNALKFSPKNSLVKVEVSPQDSFVKVTVADRGPGVPPDQQELIFQRFHQVASPDGKNKEGTGLGLAICKSIIEAHGGSIGVEGNDGQGSRFWFLIPVAAK